MALQCGSKSLELVKTATAHLVAVKPLKISTAKEPHISMMPKGILRVCDARDLSRTDLVLEALIEVIPDRAPANHAAKLHFALNTCNGHLSLSHTPQSYSSYSVHA